jgi:hypothetical protein
MADDLCRRCQGCDSVHGVRGKKMDEAVDTLLEELKSGK